MGLWDRKVFYGIYLVDLLRGMYTEIDSSVQICYLPEICKLTYKM